MKRIKLHGAAGRRTYLYLMLCSALLAVTAFAQYRAGIQGVISDPNGSVIPDATVTLVSNETNFSFTAKSGETGVYTFLALAPGSYKITVEKAGFSKKTLSSLRVD